MPHMTALVRKANQKFNALPNEGLRNELQPALQSATGLRDAIQRLGLLSELDESVVDDAGVLLDAVPRGLGAALLAAVRDAVDRNLPVTFAWRAGYDFELRIWESVAADGVGLLTVLLTAPFPRHVRARLAEA